MRLKNSRDIFNGGRFREGLEKPAVFRGFPWSYKTIVRLEGLLRENLFVLDSILGWIYHFFVSGKFYSHAQMDMIADNMEKEITIPASANQWRGPADASSERMRTLEL